MKKSILFTLLMIFISLFSFGQRVEWEIANIGIPFGHQTDNQGNYLLGHDRAFALGSEIRYNWKEANLSTGFQFTFSSYHRRVHNTKSYAYRQTPLIFLLVTDYNYNKIHKNLSLFGGVGCGYSVVDSEAQSFELKDSVMKHFALSPRIGIECFKRVRLTFEYHYIGNKNSFFNIKLGFVVGLN